MTPRCTPRLAALARGLLGEQRSKSGPSARDARTDNPKSPAPRVVPELGEWANPEWTLTEGKRKPKGAPRGS